MNFFVKMERYYYFYIKRVDLFGHAYITGGLSTLK